MRDASQEMRIDVTDHADERIRERMGLKRRAIRRAVERAWAVGGTLPAPEGYVRKGYGGNAFVFALTHDSVVCVTAYPVTMTAEYRARGYDMLKEQQAQRAAAARKRRLRRRRELRG